MRNQTWGSRLREFRRRVFRSQGELAEALSKLQTRLSEQEWAALEAAAIDPSATISYATLSRYETGQVPGRRPRHLFLVWGLVQVKCIHSHAEADEWLALAIQAPLLPHEAAAIFTEGTDAELPAAQQVASSPVSHNLPVELTPLIGRAEEVRNACTYLLEINKRFVALTGLGGMGKSRVAVAAAWQLVEREGDHFPDGIWFVSLAEVDVGDEAHATVLANHMAEALELPFAYTPNVVDRLAEFLSSKRMLLLLDTFEHVLESVEWLFALLQRAPGSKVLITSRIVPPILESIEVIPLPGLSVPASKDAPDYEHFGSVRLFLTQIRRRKPNYTPDPDDLAAIVGLCQVLEGMPLAIILAASWASHISLDEILGEVRQNIDLLATDALDIPERHRNIRALLAHTWEKLSPHLQRVLARLGVFHRGFSRHAAMTVAAAQVADLVRLMELSLMTQSPMGGYQMHELLRQFALEKLDEFGEQRIYVRRHAQYYLDWLHRQQPVLFSTDAAKGIVEIRRFLDNVRAAWEWAVHNAGDSGQWWQTIGDASWALSRYCKQVQHFPEGELRLRQAVKAFAATGEHPDRGHSDILPSIQALLLAQWAQCLVQGGQYQQAYKAVHQSLQLCVQHTDWQRKTPVWLRIEATARFALGRAYASQGRIEEALEVFQNGLGLARQAGLPYEEAGYLNELGIQALNRSDYATAEEYLAPTAQLARALGDVWQQMGALCHLCEIALERGKFTEGKVQILRTFDLENRSGHTIHADRRAHIRNVAGWIEHKIGDPNEARRQYTHGLSAARVSGSPWDIARALRGLAWAAHLEGNYHEADTLFSESLTLLQEIDHQKDIAITQNNWGFAQDLRGRHGLAIEYFSQSLVTFRALGKRYSIANTLINLGFCLLHMGDVSAAQRCLKESLSIARAIGARAVVAEAVSGYARLHLLLGSVERSIRYLAIVRMDSHSSQELVETRLIPLERDLASTLGPQQMEELLQRTGKQDRRSIELLLDEIHHR